MKPKICLVVSEFNGDITAEMQNSAVHKLRDEGLEDEYIKIIYVEGAFEIPYAISKLINKYDAFIAVGCIIKGETPNFDFISQAITSGIMQLSISNKKPIGAAVITCLDKEQAKKRIFRGEEAASAVLDLLENSYLK
jgi:6,7-dimethyl-8-ribityllumazine synthase|tara:strand:+ start:282 stop:692 length:411 start_codon:yes stop_codon:yes gene_type:complete